MAAFPFPFTLLSIFFLSLAFKFSVASASTSTSTSTPTSSRILSPFVENPLNPQYFTSSSIPTKSHLGSTLSEGCRTSLIAWKNISYPQQIMMQLYSGHSFDDLGLFDACQLLPVAHHCTVTFPIAGIQSSMGLCIPKSCTQEDMLLELPTLMGLPLGLIYDGLLISGVAGNETIAACADQQTRWYEDKGATGMVVLVIILASIVAITTVADHVLTIREFSMKQAHMRESHNYPSNAIYVALPNFVSVTNGATIQQEATSSHHTTDHVPAYAWHRFIQSFSAIRSIRSLLAPNPASSIDMSCLNGVRVLSIMWIILAHTMFFHAELFRDPIYLLTSVVNRVSIQVVLEAFFAVDSFFFLTGFLSAYLLLQQLSHTHSKLSHLLTGYYIHRYLRLTLIYFFWLCMYWKLSRYIGAGQSPTQYQLQGYVTLNKQGELVQFTKEESCDKYWWTNLLYINNYYPSHYADVCMNWSWYMANEMQFAILLPFLVLLYHRSRIAGLTFIIALLIISFTYVGIISHQHGFTTNMLHQQFNLDPQMNHDYQNLLYNKPWARMQPWLIGIAYAYLLHARPQRIPTRVYWPCMTVAAFLMVGLVFGPAQLYQEGGNDNWSRTTHDMYMATSRGMWAVGLGYLCYSMIVGTGEEPLLDASGAKETKPGSYVTSLLSHPIWTPLARLSYQAYLVHSTWIIIFIHQYRSKPYYTDLMYVYWIIGNIIMAFVLAAVGYVLVEKPLTNLTNWAMRGKGETHSADHYH